VIREAPILITSRRRLPLAKWILTLVGVEATPTGDAPTLLGMSITTLRRPNSRLDKIPFSSDQTFAPAGDARRHLVAFFPLP
jgi:hypothetical protein